MRKRHTSPGVTPRLFQPFGDYNVATLFSDKQPVTHPNTPTKKAQQGFVTKLLMVLVGLGLAGALLVGTALALVYPKLPDLASLTDYRPKVPLRVLTSDGELIAEFGEERRRPVEISQVPLIMQHAILAAEDDRFYEHGGIDYMGVVRAAVSNLIHGGKGQGASTITMQVARNFFLSREKTWTRKFYEVLLSYKIEADLSKDKILELYINQIYLGQRAYGFSAASQIYFGKRLQEIDPAEAAMLAGLPKAPSAYNPIVNPKRAKLRQEYVLNRMHELKYITDEQYKQALTEKLTYRGKHSSSLYPVDADYAAEMARQAAVEMYGDEAYTAGITVITTLKAKEQNAAQASLRDGLEEYETRQYYRGPEGFIDLPDDPAKAEEIIADSIGDYPDYDELQSAVVLSATPQEVDVSRGAGEIIKLTGKNIKPAESWLNPRAPSNKRLKRGAVVRVLVKEGQDPILTQIPEVQGALVSLDSHNGAIRALAGGFEYSLNKFNHVTQSTRQPGSSFKPFVYSGSLEKGVTPTTIINDEPISFPANTPGGKDWNPKNYDNKYDGPMLMRDGLAHSKNMVSIRILQYITPTYAQQWATRFGFDPADVPPYLTMALGAITTNPLQLASAYSVFSNGGYRIKPYLIEKIKDGSGRIVAQARPAVSGDEANRVIDARNAFMMQRLLRGVVEHGTGVRAKALGRDDIMGKTGTTNDSHDAWFAGFNPDLVAIAWVGYDQPKNLGNRETGGGLALPIWLDYMKVALKDAPVKPQVVPAGVTFVNDEYYYSEFTPGNGGIEKLGVKSDGGDIPSLFNFLKGLGNSITGGDGAKTSPPAPHSDNNTPSKVDNKPDQIERLFGR